MFLFSAFRTCGNYSHLLCMIKNVLFKERREIVSQVSSLLPIHLILWSLNMQISAMVWVMTNIANRGNCSEIGAWMNGQYSLTTHQEHLVVIWFSSAATALHSRARPKQQRRWHVYTICKTVRHSSSTWVHIYAQKSITSHIIVNRSNEHSDYNIKSE